MKELLSWLKNEESGQGMLEYGLIIALIVVAVIVVLGPLGEKIAGIFSNVTGKIPTTT